MQDDFPVQENENNRKRARKIYITVLIAVSGFCTALLIIMIVSGRNGNAPDGQKNSNDTEAYSYTYAGENDEWATEYTIAGAGKWTKTDDTLGYDGSYDTLLTISFKGDPTELSSIRHLIISYKLGLMGGSLDRTYEEGRSMDSSYSENNHSDGMFPYSEGNVYTCLLYTSPSPRDGLLSRMPSSA